MNFVSTHLRPTSPILARSAAPARLLRSTCALTLLIALGGPAWAATITWTGGAGDGSWHTAGNWDLGRAPQAGDDVLISAAGTYSVTLSAGANVDSVTVGGAGGSPTLTVSNCTLTLAGSSASTVQSGGTLRLAQATVNGPGVLTNRGLLYLVVWTSNILNTSVANENGGVLHVERGGTHTITGTLTNAAGATLSLYAFVCDSATLQLSSTFENDGDIVMYEDNFCGGRPELIISSGRLINRGLIAASSSYLGPVYLSCEVQNEGAITVDAAALYFAKADAAHINTGAIDVDGGNLILAQTGSAPSFTNDGTLSLVNAGRLTVEGGTVAYSVPAAIGAGSILSFSSSTVQLDADLVNPAGCELRLANSVVNGPGTISNEGALRFVVFSSSSTVNTAVANEPGGVLHVERGGIHSITGTLTNAAGATITLYGFNCDSATLQLSGTFENDGDIVMYESNGCGGQPQLSIPAGRLVNRGTIAASSDYGGPVVLNCEIENQGSVNVSTATLWLAGSGFAHVNAGTMVIGPSAAAALSGGSLSQTNGLLTVNGALQLSGGTLGVTGGALAGSGIVSGSVSNTGGTVRPGTSPGTLTINGSYTQGNLGTLEIEVGGPTPGTEFDVLNVSGTATLGGTLRATLINGYNPGGQTFFQFLTYGGHSGTFGQVLPCNDYVDYAASYASVAFQHTGPYFNGHSGDQTVQVGDTAGFSAPASGGGTPTYQWHKNGNPLSDGPTGSGSTISGATTDAVTITNAQPGDAGSYSVRAVTECGSAFSPPAELTVMGPSCVGWQLVATTGPSARMQHAMAYDSARGRVVLFGGYFSNQAFGDLWEWDGTSWSQVEQPPQRPSPRYGHALAYDSARGVTVLFGGYNGSSYFHDTWEWNGSIWSLRSNAPTDPYAQSGHALVYDNLRARTLLISSRYGAMWEWDGSTWSTARAGPNSAYAQSGVFDTARAVAVIVGGTASQGTWEWDGAAWARRSTSAPAYGAGAMVYDGARGVTLWTGGQLQAGLPANETWEWNGTTWNRVSTRGINQLRSPAAAFDSSRGVCVLFGGRDGQYRGETWEFRAPAPVSIRSQPDAQRAVVGATLALAVDAAASGSVSYQWRRDGVPLVDGTTATGSIVSGAGTNAIRLAGAQVADSGQYSVLITSDCGAVASAAAAVSIEPQLCLGWVQEQPLQVPPTLSGAAMCHDSLRGRTVLFGGSTTGSIYAVTNQTWEWDGQHWHGPAAAGGPSPRTGHAMVFDQARARVVLYGGRTSGYVTLADTWEWDGTTWNGPFAGPGPGYRADHAMAYDSARGVSVLFGGANSDTWEWNGAVWSRAATTGPSPRQSAAMAYDAARGVTVLFGGSDNSHLDDTWEWDGSSWTLRAADGPPARFRHTLVYDANAGGVVLFGGVNSAGQADTWLWNGTTWTRIHADGISGRMLHAAAYDSTRGQMVVFGGTSSAGVLGDTWVFGAPDGVAITDHPDPTSVPFESTATFSITATGGNLTYQWRRNGVALADGQTPGGSTISGATTANLSISNAQFADEGTYDCLVSNPCGSVESNDALLDVNPVSGPRVFLARIPHDQCVGPGETITVELRMADLFTDLVDGYQAFLHFDPTQLAFVSGTYTETPFGTHLVDPIAATPAGDIDIAAGIAIGQTATSEPALLATLQFTVLAGAGGPSAVVFRAGGPDSVLIYDGEDLTTNLDDLPAVDLDTTPPTLTPPSDVTVECSDPNDPSFTGAATVVDNNDAVPIVTYTDVETPGACPAERIITRTWHAVDCAGNQTQADQLITVDDSRPPEITTGAGDTTVECDGAGNTAALDAWLSSFGGAAAQDNCGNVVWTHDFTALSDGCGTAGSATVTFTATDDCGNSSTTIATFAIEDTTAPQITTAASDQTVECDGAGNTAALTAWLDSHGGAVATDACGNVAWTHNFTALSDDCGATGSAMVTFTATDDCGNASTTSATFTIADTTPPSFSSAPANLDLPCGPTTASQISTWLASAAASDACGSATITHNYTGLSGGGCAGTGSASVTWTATDACGHVSTHIATVTVTDTTPPLFVNATAGALPGITVNADAGLCTAAASSVGLTTPVVTDACDAAVAVTGVRSDNAALTDPWPSSASTTVTWTATDDCGNVGTATQVITVNPVNVVDVQVQLGGSGFAASMTRCVTFELFSCPNTTPLFIEEEVTFLSGMGALQLEVPCGVYTCLTARDRRHTLRRTDDSFGIVGTQYRSRFILRSGVFGGPDDDSLASGNLNDDRFIDIRDYSRLINRFGQSVGADTLCGQSSVHPDFNGDGVVTAADFAILAVNFLRQRDPNCCDGAAFDELNEGPLTMISVADLVRAGEGELAAADLNGDGWIDSLDVIAFLNGARPAEPPSDSPAADLAADPPLGAPPTQVAPGATEPAAPTGSSGAPHDLSPGGAAPPTPPTPTDEPETP